MNVTLPFRPGQSQPWATWLEPSTKVTKCGAWCWMRYQSHEFFGTFLSWFQTNIHGVLRRHELSKRKKVKKPRTCSKSDGPPESHSCFFHILFGGDFYDSKKSTAQRGQEGELLQRDGLPNFDSEASAVPQRWFVSPKTMVLNGGYIYKMASIIMNLSIIFVDLNVWVENGVAGSNQSGAEWVPMVGHPARGAHEPGFDPRATRHRRLDVTHRT